MAAKKAKRKVKKPAARKPAARKRPAKQRKFKSLADVRKAIDAMDRKLVPLLCERLYYVTQAAQFKPSVEGVVVQSRVEEIVDSVRRMAASAGGSPDTIETVYRALIDAFTADEQSRWRELHARP
jgi:isochorismate pyruvate lyase